MGMDAYVFKAKTKKVFDSDNWFSREDVTEVWYARKYWDLVYNLSFLKDLDADCGEFIQLTKENVEEMIKVATHNPDYWDGFDTVPALCKILRDFDEEEEAGWHYYFEFDY